MKFIYTLKKIKSFLKDENFKKVKELTLFEKSKTPIRSVIINHFLGKISGQYYLEIGVRDPKNNFEKIICKNKYSVDPGIEFKENPVDFKLTSDDFFNLLRSNKLDKLDNNIKFDVIFIDGLHLAEQVERDILNSLEFIKDTGLIILHDCNPPSEYHQREDYSFLNSPAGVLWNGTTWKAYYKFRHRKDLFSICYNTDWGVGVISKTKYEGFNNLNIIENEFYEYNSLNKNRIEHLNLKDFKI
jgi:hypothetical protein